jgi:hypothetical protein
VFPLQLRSSKTEVPAKSVKWNCSWSCPEFQDHFSSRLERGKASLLTTKKCRRENQTWFAREKAREFILLSLLATSLLLSKTSDALAGNAAGATAGQNPDRGYTLTAGELISAVVANELTDREQFRKWICMIEKRAGKQTLTQVQVETKDGPLYRLLAIDGTALNLIQRQQDQQAFVIPIGGGDARIGKLMKDPRPLLKLRQAQYEDEIKLQKLMSLMPQAFVYDYDGVEENLLRIKFRPNPGYSPPTYEARVIHSLAGTILIDSERKRLAKVAGHLMNRVEFGYGLLGRIDSGTLELERVEVGPQLWKTALINIHFSGRVAIFKTINKDQYERRSDFRTVSSDLSLSDAKDLLISRLLPAPQVLSAAE